MAQYEMVEGRHGAYRAPPFTDPKLTTSELLALALKCLQASGEYGEPPNTVSGTYSLGIMDAHVDEETYRSPYYKEDFKAGWKRMKEAMKAENAG